MEKARTCLKKEIAHRRSETGGMLASLGAISFGVPEFSSVTGERAKLYATGSKPVENSVHFINHLQEKIGDCLDTAKLLLEIMKEKDTLQKYLHKDKCNPTLWIINPSYYSIFFNAQLLLAYDGKKLPENVEDTHKTVFLALLYYFIIKGSGLEGKKNIKWEDIKSSRLSTALLMFQEAQEEAEELLQKAKSTIEDFNAELEKRRRFTYQMNVHAKESIALTSYQRAISFRTIITEYITTLKRR